MSSHARRDRGWSGPQRAGRCRLPARAGARRRGFERRDIVGGACVTEEPVAGVRASPAHTRSHCSGARSSAGLDLPAPGASTSRSTSPIFFAPFPDGRRVVTWTSRERTAAQLEREWSPADADGYVGWSERWDRAAESARPLLLEPPERDRWAELIRTGAAEGSIADELAGIPSESVRVPFAIQGLIGTLAGPDDPGTRSSPSTTSSARRPVRRAPGDSYEAGWKRYVLRSARPPSRQAPASTSNSPVGQNVTDWDGSSASSSRTAASAGCRSALECRPAPHRHPCGIARAGELAAGVPVVKVMVLLDGLPDFPAWPGAEPWAGTIDICVHDGRPRLAADYARAGRPAARPWIEAACQTAADPTPGARRKTCPLDVLPVLPARGRRLSAADAAIARFAQVCPDLPDRVIDRLRWGPPSWSSGFGLTAATSSTARCSANSCWSAVSRPAGSAGSRAIYLAGSGAHPGGAVTGAPGYSRRARSSRTGTRPTPSSH